MVGLPGGRGTAYTICVCEIIKYQARVKFMSCKSSNYTITVIIYQVICAVTATLAYICKLNELKASFLKTTRIASLG